MRRVAYFSLVLVLVLAALITACSQSTPTPTPSQSPTTTASPSASPTASPKPTSTPTAKPAAKEWVSMTAAETSTGYKDGQALARIANLALQQAGIPLTMKNVTGPGSTVNHRSYDKGETDMLYQSTISVSQAWENLGPFTKDPLKHRTYQGIYMLSMNMFPVIKPGDKDKIKSYADLAGKKIFPHQTGSAAYEASQMAFGSLGLWSKLKDTQMNTQEVGSSVRSGILDAVVFTGVGGGRSTSAWYVEMVMTTDLWVVPPTEQEKQVIAAVKGLTPVTISPQWLFPNKDVGTKDIWTFSMYQGWNFPSYGTEQEVYTIVKAWYENTKDLIAIDPAFQEFADIGLKFNAQIIDSLKEIPVHPGVAKYYKEKGIWKDTWKIGTVEPKNW
ncbi:MAG: TAXI family TRAP transporter solute-binding subunit [Dehalococcoidales bacterium]|nr:TAXI family TRAP transporter solute-binding subunit [Dehalococcoidales bacterium]